jgi:hypothetical protein
VVDPAPSAAERRTVRQLVGRALPDGVRRSIDGFRARRVMSLIVPANREFARRHGLTVSDGPFAGMSYLPEEVATQGNLVSKLGGFYERELREAVQRWPDEPQPDVVVNVGCAEGYYAVGLALLLPQAQILAYDINLTLQDKCRRLAELNGVADRVTVGGECTPATLAGLRAQRLAVFCDCEGYELTLLDPTLAPILSSALIIVELHDLDDPRITPTLLARFEASHEIELIAAVASSQAPVDLSYLTERQRQVVQTERPLPMNWADMRPRAERVR